MVEKVTDPAKKVTDILVLRELIRQGIDKDYVEFSQDYASRSLGKGHSPYAKFYRDLKSNKRFMVVSGLPMVDAEGRKIEVGWSDNPVKFKSKNNLFNATVNGLDVELVVRNDQPDGRKKNDRLNYHPQLFLDGVEQLPVSTEATLLPIDPTNGNYQNNVLEWDYGICKRRLRVIEGRIHGYWIFPANPNGEVLIRYNQTGDYKLKLGEFATEDDTETISADVFDQAGYPIVVSDSDTFYPDAGVNSVDGHVYYDTTTTWATMHDATDGTGAEDVTDGNSWKSVGISAGASDPQWDQLGRTFFLFDTSGLDDGAIVSAATLSFYAGGKVEALAGSFAYNIYSANPASDTALGIADYNQVGTTPFSTAITRTNITIGTPGTINDFILNASGYATDGQLNRQGVSKYSLREVNYDVADGPPTWDVDKSSSINPWFSEKGAGYKPKLVVTFTLPSTGVENKSANMAAKLMARGLI